MFSKAHKSLFCPLQEMVAVKEVVPSGSSRMIYGSVSWVAVGPGPTVAPVREQHCRAQSETGQNSKDIAMLVIKWIGMERSCNELPW